MTGKRRAPDAVLLTAAQRGCRALAVHVTLLDDGAVRIVTAPPTQVRRVLPQSGHAETVNLVEGVSKEVLRVTRREVESGRRRRVEAVDVIQLDGVEPLARAHPQPLVQH